MQSRGRFASLLLEPNARCRAPIGAAIGQRVAHFAIFNLQFSICALLFLLLAFASPPRASIVGHDRPGPAEDRQDLRGGRLSRHGEPIRAACSSRPRAISSPPTATCSTPTTSPPCWPTAGSSTAKLLGADPRLEVAVLKIEAAGLPCFDLDKAVKAEAGARVLAFSNLFGVAVGDEPASVQKGTVSVSRGWRPGGACSRPPITARSTCST